jgi:hypothetical protein
MVLTYDAYSETIEQQKQKEDRLTVMEKQMQALLTAIGNMKGDQDKVYEFSKALFDSGILKTTQS